jgi:hypothetical protein
MSPLKKLDNVMLSTSPIILSEAKNLLDDEKTLRFAPRASPPGQAG